MVEGDEARHRQIAPAVVVAVEEGELLSPVGGIIRRIQIDRDVLAAPPQPPAMPLDHALGQRLAHPIQIRPARGVLKARERRLRGEHRPGQGIPIEQELVDRIRAQTRRIVPIGVTAGDPEKPLAQQITHRVLDLARSGGDRPSTPPAAGSDPSVASHALSRIAPPSELPCSSSNCARSGLGNRSGNRTHCRCAIFNHAKAS